MFNCPYCGSNSIMIIDLAEPPQMFECGGCTRRFHSRGFSPTEVDMRVSLGKNEQVILDILHGR